MMMPTFAVIARSLAFGYSGAMRFFVLATGALAGLAWAAGCSDDSGVTPSPNDAGTEAAVTPPNDAGNETSTNTLDCSKDVDLDGVKKHLACTGLYSSFATKTVASDVKEYKPALEFWSDGAEKKRWVKLAPGAKIDATSFDEWIYPDGTQLWKEFKVDGKLVETRLFEKGALGWSHTVYRWNAAETDATRKETGELIPPNGIRTKSYEIPNTTQCTVCHSGRIEPVLGFDAIGLGLPGAEGVTLASLSADGRFTAAIPATSLALPDDGAGAREAFGYLHINCGTCHNDNQGAGAFLTKPKLLARPSHLLGLDGGVDGGGPATVQTLSLYATTVCQASYRSDPDGGSYLFIRGGSPGSSLLSVLASSRVAEGQMPTSTAQMPPLVTRAVDPGVASKLDAWITNLAPCP
jgi:hypothetical protein